MFTCADPEGGLGVQTSPLKNYKNIGFLSSSGPDPRKNYEDTEPAFNVMPSSARQRNDIKWRFAGGPTMVRL